MSKSSTRPDTVTNRPGEAGTVLLVEDEPGVRHLARRVLENAGYRVVEARSGAQALERLEELAGPPRLVVTDMNMPGMHGSDLARRVRERFPRCPVLLMSGYTEAAVSRRSGLDGGTAFIEKPFTPTELREKVNAQLTADQPGR